MTEHFRKQIVDALLAMADAVETSNAAWLALDTDAVDLTRSAEELACGTAAVTVAASLAAKNGVDDVIAALDLLPPRKAALALVGLACGVTRRLEPR
jgi:hypothetical protein